MALKAIITDLTEAPETVRSLYRAGTKEEGADGKFVLDVEGSGDFELVDTSRLKGALSTERSRAEAAERKVKAFDGLDPEAVRKNLSAYEELKKLDPAKEADRLAEQKAQAKIDQMAKQHGEELAKANGRAEKLMKGLEGSTLKAAINKAMAGANVENTEAVSMKLRQHIRLKDTGNDDDPFAIEVIGADGNPLVDSQGKNVTLEGFTADLRKDPKWAVNFKPEGKSGSGAGTGGTSGSKTITRAAFEALPHGERSAQMRAGVQIVD